MTSRAPGSTEFLRRALSQRLPAEALDTAVEYLCSLPASEESLDEMTGFLTAVVEGSADDGLREELSAYLRLRATESAAVTSSTRSPPSVELASLLSREEDKGASRGGDSVCGCMATRHAYLGSCLGCGRLFCEKEQLGQCLFCGGAVCAPCSADDLVAKGMTDEIVLKAYRHKDKLLLFDKENSRRTQVFDAQVRAHHAYLLKAAVVILLVQGDYYESAAWLSPEEKARADESERRRRERLHQRRQHRVHLVLDSK